jgi:hypothetical protein
VDDVDDAADPKAAIVELLLAAASAAGGAAQVGTPPSWPRSWASFNVSYTLGCTHLYAFMHARVYASKGVYFIATFPHECMGQLASFGPT